MPTITTIPTYTLISAIVPSADITTYYQDLLSGWIYSAFINNQYRLINNNPILEGYLVMIGESGQVPENLDFEIDINGFLLAIGDGTEVNKYAIDANGNLTYTQ